MSKKDKKESEPTPVASSGWKPVPKASAALIAGALTTILIAVLAQFDVEITAEVAAAVTTVLVFIASWFAPKYDANS
jgi:hypothetical protein